MKALTSQLSGDRVKFFSNFYDSDSELLSPRCGELDSCILLCKKRVCKPVEAIPKEADAFLIGCAMELDSKEKISANWGPRPAKTKQNSVIFENHGSRGTAQPCPRCIAGESGHFNHILGF